MKRHAREHTGDDNARKHPRTLTADAGRAPLTLPTVNLLDCNAWHLALSPPPFASSFLLAVQSYLDTYDALYRASLMLGGVIFHQLLADLFKIHYPRRTEYLIDYLWLLWALRSPGNSAVAAACLAQWQQLSSCMFDEHSFPYAALSALFGNNDTTASNHSRGAVLLGSDAVASLHFFNELCNHVSQFPIRLFTHILSVSGHAMRAVMLRSLTNRTCQSGVLDSERVIILNIILSLKRVDANLVTSSVPALLRMYVNGGHILNMLADKEVWTQICYYFSQQAVTSGSRYMVEHLLFPHYTAEQLLSLLRLLRKHSGNTHWVGHFLEPIFDVLAMSSSSGSDVICDAFKFIIAETDLCQTVLTELGKPDSQLHTSLLGALNANNLKSENIPLVLRIWQDILCTTESTRFFDHNGGVIVVRLLQIDMKGNIHFRSFLNNVLQQYNIYLTDIALKRKPRAKMAIDNAVQAVLGNTFATPHAFRQLLVFSDGPLFSPFVTVLERLSSTVTLQQTLGHLTALFTTLKDCLTTTVDNNNNNHVNKNDNVRYILATTVYHSKVFELIASILQLLPQSATSLAERVLDLLNELSLPPDTQPLSGVAVQALVRGMAHYSLAVSKRISSLFYRLLPRNAPDMVMVREHIVRGFFASYDHHFRPEQLLKSGSLSSSQSQRKLIFNDEIQQDKDSRLKHLLTAFANVTNDLGIRLDNNDVYRVELLQRASIPLPRAATSTMKTTAITTTSIDMLPSPYILHLVTLTGDQAVFTALHGVQMARELSQLPLPSASLTTSSLTSTISTLTDISQMWLDRTLEYLYTLLPDTFPQVLLLPVLNSMFYANTSRTRAEFLALLERMQPVSVASAHVGLFTLLIEILMETERRGRQAQLQDAVWWCAAEGMLRVKFMASG